MVKEVRNSCRIGPSQQSALQVLSNLTSKWCRALGSCEWQNLGFSGSRSVVLVHSFVKLWGLNETDQQRHPAFYYFFKTSSNANLHLVPMVTGIKGVPSDDLVGLCVIWIVVILTLACNWEMFVSQKCLQLVSLVEDRARRGKDWMPLVVINYILITQDGISHQGLVGASQYHLWILRTESLDWVFSQAGFMETPSCL